MSGSRQNLELVLTPYGMAELVDTSDGGEGDVLWSSDADDDFRDDFNDELLSQDDAEDIIQYLMDAGVISEDEAASLQVYEESLGDESANDDDED